MSVVVAIRDEDRIWLATDSQMTIGHTKLTINVEHSFKIFKFPSGINMGGVGSLRDLNIISTSDEDFISEVSLMKNEITFKNIVRETVPKVFGELDKFNRIGRYSGISEMESAFFIAYKDNCFLINSDGAVIELVDMLAVGSGGNVAESVYTVLRDTKLTPKEKAIRSVMSSCERDLYVNYPIVITNTLTEEYEIFDGKNFYTLKDGELILIPDEEEEIEQIEMDTEKQVEMDI